MSTREGDADEAKRAQWLGALLKAAREVSGLSAKAVLKKSGYRAASPSLVYHAERGRMTLSADTLENVATTLGLDASDILRRAGYEEGEYRSVKLAPSGENGIRLPWWLEVVQNAVSKLALEKRSPLLSDAHKFVGQHYVVAGIAAAAAVPVIMPTLMSAGEGSKTAEGAATLFLTLVRESPETTLGVAAAMVSLVAGKTDEAKGFEPFQLSADLVLESLLGVCMAMDPVNARRSLEAGLTCGVGGYFIGPVAIGALAAELSRLDIEAVLNIWKRGAKSEQVTRLVERTKDEIAGAVGLRDYMEYLAKERQVHANDL